MLRIPYDQARDALSRVLTRFLSAEDSAALAGIFTENSLEGVYSHGINRFPRMVAAFESGSIDASVTKPVFVRGKGGLEVWDACFGVGPLIATASMERAIALAREHGVACVGLRNNNHWLRAGTYGMMAARAGMIGLCFTNTKANMPAWGSADACVGNNPMSIAVPRRKGHVVMDMAASQFSYGKLEVLALQGEQLPVCGGYDSNGALTRDPQAILETRRVLPIGYWKGSSLSILLDMVASGVSLGRTVQQITQDPGDERGMSQVFIAVDFAALVDADEADKLFDQIVDTVRLAAPAEPGKPARVPGERIEALREENLARGIPVNEKTWARVQEILAARRA